MKPHKQQPEPTKMRKLVKYYYATQSLFCNFHRIEQQAKAVGEIHVRTAVTCTVMGKTCYRHVYQAVVCKCCGTYILKALLMNRPKYRYVVDGIVAKYVCLFLRKISFEYASHFVSIDFNASYSPPLSGCIKRYKYHTPVQEELIKSREISADQGFYLQEQLPTRAAYHVFVNS